MVVAFIIGELAALVGLNGGAAFVIYFISIIVTVAMCYGFVFVKKTIKTEYIVVIVFSFLAVMNGYLSYSKQESIFKYYDSMQYESDNKNLQVTGKVSKIEEKEYGYVIEMDVEDGIVMIQLNNNEGSQAQMKDINLKDTSSGHINMDDIRYGMRLSVAGIVNPMKTADNPGNYNEKKYLHSNGVLLKVKAEWKDVSIVGDGEVYSFVSENLHLIRKKAIDILSLQCSEKEMGLLSAIVLGDKSYMDEEVNELYANQGLAHVLTVLYTPCLDKHLKYGL